MLNKKVDKIGSVAEQLASILKITFCMIYKLSEDLISCVCDIDTLTAYHVRKVENDFSPYQFAKVVETLDKKNEVLEFRMLIINDEKYLCVKISATSEIEITHGKNFVNLLMSYYILLETVTNFNISLFSTPLNLTVQLEAVSNDELEKGEPINGVVIDDEEEVMDYTNVSFADKDPWHIGNIAIELGISQSFIKKFLKELNYHVEGLTHLSGPMIKELHARK
tara:strand:+ start:968 stop:1636 length:669 start_codon:yes stop_codon:yes gene_type:complete